MATGSGEVELSFGLPADSLSGVAAQVRVQTQLELGGRRWGVSTHLEECRLLWSVLVLMVNRLSASGECRVFKTPGAELIVRVMLDYLGRCGLNRHHSKQSCCLV